MVYDGRLDGKLLVLVQIWGMGNKNVGFCANAMNELPDMITANPGYGGDRHSL